jgi:pimeloyl-ACP methyl ester carboxylesterase
MVTVNGGGHFLALGKPQAVITALKDFTAQSTTASK